jgi:NAD(P)H dehydrogenase (quinone)
MILIIGASGKTGRSIIQFLKNSGEGVRALVHRPDQVGLLKAAGAHEVVVGDLQSQPDLAQAFQGIRAVYHICPNMHPQEVQIGRNVIEAALQAKVERFVFHSVLHPQTEAMPHHWNKLRVEEMILTTGLTYTILQPCAYMQNVLGYWAKITGENVYPVPYSVHTRLSMVDLEDVACVAAKVLVEQGHQNATFELCGPEALTQNEVAVMLSQVLGRSISAVELDLDTWEKQARAGGMNEYARQTLLKMFTYYNRYGLTGSPSVLAWLLRREPTTFRDFVVRTVKEKNASTTN